MADRTHTRRDVCRVGALSVGTLVGIAGAGRVAAEESGSDDSTGTGTESPTAGGYERVRKFWPEDGAAGDQFGWSVAMDGATAVVGARRRTHANGTSAGSVAVFEKTRRGWTRSALLAPDDGDPNDRFGNAVDVDGSTIVVGARGDEDPNGVNAGSAYVFERTDGEWRQERKLSPEDVDRDDEFGTAVAVAGDTVAVGAFFDEGPGGRGRGSAHVFRRSDGEWTREGKLVPEPVDSGDRFGWDLGLDGERLVVSAPNEDVSGQANGGSVRVFRRQDGAWYQEERLSDETMDRDTRYGTSIALDGTTLVVGDPEANDVFVYDRNDRVWGLTKVLTPRIPDPETDLEFGFEIDLDGGTILVGSPGRGQETAYEFRNDGDRWRRETVLGAYDDRSGADFGMAVATVGSSSIVGAPGDRRDGANRVGSAFVFDREVAARKADPTTTGDSERSLPGFGPVTAVLGLGGGYLWKRLQGSDD